ncbi:MAG: aldehyde dehydrogenase family protein [Acidobacteria bacterium]|nr:aldehyde dehydrogenase family protein [Acidobacteriota bacterium]
MEALPMYIGGEWVRTAVRQTVELPYDGSPVGACYAADAGVVAGAIEGARRGAKEMRRLANFERADLLARMTEIVKRDLAEFANLICRETGKPVREARMEAGRALQTMIASAEVARNFRGEAIPIDGAPVGKGRMAMTVREPLGVIGAITPFNMPFNLMMHKVGPALAAGNAIIHKPASATPLSALRFARAVEEAGAPAGAYNIVTGAGSVAGSALVDSPHVAMITFTGSREVGLGIRAQAGLKRVTLELGGNSALVIEPDADLDTAVARSVIGGFAHSGQVCISVQRIYVHDSIAGEFLDKFAAATGELRIGHPFEEATDISSLITEAEARRVESWIDEAKRQGARLVRGGDRNRATVEPTILADTPRSVRISCQEVFGPVVVVNRYQNLEQAIALVNDSVYGLQAGIFTRDLERAFRAAREFEVGGVIVNDVPMFRADHMPYGGVKESGTGREGPKYAAEEMSEMKLICWKV